MAEWIKYLDENELKCEAPPLFMFDEDPEDTAVYMYREGFPEPIMKAGDKDKLIEKADRELKSRPPKKYWEQVKKEMFVLICTDHEKYSDLRKSLNEVKEKSTKYILTTIAGVVGGILGVEAGVISGFCVILLHSALKIGKESYCAINREYA